MQQWTRQIQAILLLLWLVASSSSYSEKWCRTHVMSDCRVYFHCNGKFVEIQKRGNPEEKHQNNPSSSSDLKFAAPPGALAFSRLLSPWPPQVCLQKSSRPFLGWWVGAVEDRGKPEAVGHVAHMEMLQEMVSPGMSYLSAPMKRSLMFSSSLAGLLPNYQRY